MSQSVSHAVQVVMQYLPNLLAAFFLILCGWLLGLALRRLSSKLMRRGLQLIARKPLLFMHLERFKAYQQAPMVVGFIVFWIVMILFTAAAVEALGLQSISAVLGKFTTYLPRVLGSALIVLFGVIAGDMAKTFTTKATESAGVSYAEAIGRVIQVTVVVVALMIAIDQLGIDSSVLSTTLSIIVATSFGAAALAFGLGAKSTVSNIIACHYIQKTYRVGNIIQLDSWQGRISEITHTSVILETEQGRVVIPAQRFSDAVSVLLPGGV